MPGNLRKGLRYEELARSYLQRRGLILVDSNYRKRGGEIDLIMRDGATLCFVEVKYRESMVFGGAACALPRGKQRKIVQTAQFYLAENARYLAHPLRFDALLIQRQPDGRNDLQWIKNAFYAD